MNIYLRHHRHGCKVAISDLEAREDMERGWEEYDPSEDETETPASAEMSASEDSVSRNALKTRRRKSASND
jgi:hypothetical protein